jgi:hypothetical protein
MVDEGVAWKEDLKSNLRRVIDIGSSALDGVHSCATSPETVKTKLVIAHFFDPVFMRLRSCSKKANC